MLQDQVQNANKTYKYSKSYGNVRNCYLEVFYKIKCCREFQNFFEKLPATEFFV